MSLSCLADRRIASLAFQFHVPRKILYKEASVIDRLDKSQVTRLKELQQFIARPVAGDEKEEIVDVPMNSLDISLTFLRALIG